MKTKFAFLLAASLLGVTSCTEDEAFNLVSMRTIRGMTVSLRFLSM